MTEYQNFFYLALEMETYTKTIPDLLCVLGPSESYQALCHGEENLLNACIQLYWSASITWKCQHKDTMS